MKLCNLASLDPALRASGRKNLEGASRADREVWDSFQADWIGMAIEAERLAVQKALRQPTSETESRGDPSRETERIGTVVHRRAQNFFREMILASYCGKCCITGNPVSQLLVASHILPWSKYPEHRLDPRNGLCLARTQDAAFDRGLITIDDDLTLVVSRQIRNYLPNVALQRGFLDFEGKRIEPPERFHPDPGF